MIQNSIIESTRAIKSLNVLKALFLFINQIDQKSLERSKQNFVSNILSLQIFFVIISKKWRVKKLIRVFTRMMMIWVYMRIFTWLLFKCAVTLKITAMLLWMLIWLFILNNLWRFFAFLRWSNFLFIFTLSLNLIMSH